MLTRSKKATTNSRHRAGTTRISIFLINADSLTSGYISLAVTVRSHPGSAGCPSVEEVEHKADNECMLVGYDGQRGVEGQRTTLLFHCIQQSETKIIFRRWRGVWGEGKEGHGGDVFGRMGFNTNPQPRTGVTTCTSRSRDRFGQRPPGAKVALIIFDQRHIVTRATMSLGVTKKRPLEKLRECDCVFHAQATVHLRPGAHIRRPFLLMLGLPVPESGNPGVGIQKQDSIPSSTSAAVVPNTGVRQQVTGGDGDQ